MRDLAKALMLGVVSMVLLLAWGRGTGAEGIPYPVGDPSLEGYEGEPREIEKAVIAESLVYMERETGSTDLSPLSAAYVVTPKLVKALLRRMEAAGGVPEDELQRLSQRWLGLAWEYYTWVLFELKGPEEQLVEVGSDRHVRRVVLEDDDGVRYRATHVATQREPVYNDALEGWVAQYSAFFPVPLQDLAAGSLHRLRMYVSTENARSMFEFVFSPPES